MSHKKLDAWQKAMAITVEIYKLTKEIPKDELYGLTSQMRRSAVSIPSNIAEGCARQSDKETIQFLYISIGSIAELETQILLAKELGYLKDIENILNSLNSEKGIILGLIKYLKDKPKT